ncbi:MAG TPA: NAD(P)-dependent oxidoreductase [Actinocrinis sp.]|nr:NAD(P)-dependent oxidoreductase [Actinocrinis sp.]
MSTILVTGATGKVGSRLVPRLLGNLEAGERVRVLVRRAEAGRPFADLGAEVVLGDLTEPAGRAAALAGADVVVNGAATFRGGVGQAEMDAVNRDAAVALGRDAAVAGVRRFVQLSTNLVYGPGRGRPAREDDDLRAVGSYPGSKREAEEQLVGISQATGLGLVRLRLSFVYGDGDPHLQEYLPRTAHLAAHQRLSMIHHADVGQAVLRALRANGIEGRAYNVADEGPITAWDAHALCGSVLDTSQPAATAAVEDPWAGVVDSSLIRSELGFRPFYPTAWSAQSAGAL